MNRIYSFEDPLLENTHVYSGFIGAIYFLQNILQTIASVFLGFGAGLLFSELPIFIPIFVMSLYFPLWGLWYILELLWNRSWENGDKLTPEEKMEIKKTDIQKLGYESLEAFDEYVLKEHPKKIKAKV